MTDIAKWLNSVTSCNLDSTSHRENQPTPQRPPQSHKRRYPLSPEPEDSCMAGLSTPTKRRKRDDNQTPRAAILNPTAPRSASSSPTKSSASFRSCSQASSSRRKFSSLDVGEEGIVKRQLSGLRTQHLPPAIRSVLLKIRQIERCKGVLSPTLDPADFEALRDDFDLDLGVFADSVNDGSRLTPGDVMEIESDARRCFEMDHDEPVWNAEVHTPLLKMVFRKPSSNQGRRLVDFSLCTTASIIREYLQVPTIAPDRRIDFCIYIDPLAEPRYAAQVDALREELPETSINHTSYTALRRYPTTVSLETKRSGNDFDGAVLQIAVWQAAHWKMLRSLLHKAARRRLDSPASSSQDDVSLDQGPGAQYVDECLRTLGALHGIYSQGHEWYYVATSPEMTDRQGRPSLRTVLWLHELIGRTNSALGIHRISAFLEYIKDWSASTYWPWFKQYILD